MRQRDVREVATQHVGASAQRVIALIHRIAAEHRHIAADSRLRVDDRIPADNHRTLVHVSGHVQAAEQHKDMPRQVTFHLHRTEDAGRIVHLLAGGNVDILANISSTARRLGQRGRAEQKQKGEAAEREVQQVSPKESNGVHQQIRKQDKTGSLGQHFGPTQIKRLEAPSPRIYRKLVPIAADDIHDQPDQSRQNQ